MQKSKISIQWGRYPKLWRLILVTLILAITAVVLLVTKSWVAGIIMLAVDLILYLLSLFHCVIKTPNHYIFVYSGFFIIRKDEGLLLRASLDKYGNDCAQYFIGEKRPLYLYNSTTKIAAERAAVKDQTDYEALFNSIKKNTITAKPAEAKSFSKLGGVPDLPVGFTWPTYQNDTETIMPCEIKDRPMSFLMQVDFADIKQFDTENLLPEDGVLSIFYDNLSQPLGDNKHQQNGLKAYYFDTKTELKPTKKNFPKNEWASDGEFYIREQFLAFERHFSVPDADEYEAQTKQNFPNYTDELIKRNYDEANSHTHFLGYARNIQDPAINIVNNFCSPDRAQNYILLLQIASYGDQDNNFNLADNGMLYIFIDKQDLKQNNFDNLIYTVQFY